MEDDRIAVIETQLAQARQAADEADRKYTEVKQQFGQRRFGFRETAQATLSSLLLTFFS
jgi:F0F1-type ATP synthase membrane subunit b/b'